MKQLENTLSLRVDCDSSSKLKISRFSRKKSINKSGRLTLKKLTAEEHAFLETCEGRTLAEKIYLFTNPRQFCVCGKPAIFSNYTKGYRKYCSPQCSNADPEKINKTKASFEAKYGAGVTNAQQIPGVSERTKDTKMALYGYSGANVVLAQQTKLRRYGDPGFVNIEKGMKTKLTKYGSPGYNNREKARTTCLEKYGCA